MREGKTRAPDVHTNSGTGVDGSGLVVRVRRTHTASETETDIHRDSRLGVRSSSGPGHGVVG